MDQDLSKPPAYGEDLHAWAYRQAELLRSGRLGELDIENVAEEIESLGRSQASALQSSFRLIALHLLKMIHQPERRTEGWRNTIARERIDAEQNLEENPSLKPRRDELFRKGYSQARKLAAIETNLPSRLFPVEPPFGLEQLQDQAYFPGDRRA